MVTWNFDLKIASQRQWMIEVHHPEGSQEVIQWAKGEVEELSFFLNSRLVRKRRIPTTKNEYPALMNLALHSTIKIALEKHQEFMLSPVSGATTQDYQNEFKALQWVQASFGMVERALASMKERKDLILTGAFFSGIEPETGNLVLRIIIFNLDIFYYLSDDNTLRVIIFDDKNHGVGESKGPSFQQIIKVTKPQFYDEIVKLVHRIAMAGEIID